MEAVPLYLQLAERIRRGVREGTYAPGERLPPETALARSFGVSRGTIRQALGALGRQGLVETVAGRGTFVRATRPIGELVGEGGGRSVGMVIPAVAQMRIPELIAGAEAALRAAGYTLLLGSSGDDRDQEADQIRRFLGQEVGGLIVYPIDGPSDVDLLHQLVSASVPIVFVDRYLVDLPVDAVVADNIGGALLAVRHLVAAGRRRIGFVSTRNVGTSSVAERQAGYRWALDQRGCPFDPRLVCTGLDHLFHWPAAHSREAQGNQEQLRRYLIEGGRPDAVFAVNDTVAFQVLEAAEVVGLQVPDDLAVVGFDNLAYPDYGGVPLTTVEQPRQELGATAARLLLERIDGRREGVMRITLSTRLIVRRSSGGEARPIAKKSGQAGLVAVAGAASPALHPNGGTR
jgi:DNA-binding LacI/PurR family transcriptional regulator